MRKIALVYFTYNEDEELLKQALRAIPHLRKNDPDNLYDVFVIDDATFPLSSIPENVNYIKRITDSNENLNGEEWVKKEIEFFYAVMIMGGYDFVIKVDCDTYVNNLSFLDEEYEIYKSYYGKNKDLLTLWGKTIPMSKSCVEKLYEIMTNNSLLDMFKEHEKIKGEDEAIRELSSFFKFSTKILGDEREVWPYYIENNIENDFHWLKNSFSVEFKNRMCDSSIIQYTIDREDAISRMKKYADLVDSINNE